MLRSDVSECDRVESGSPPSMLHVRRGAFTDGFGTPRRADLVRRRYKLRGEAIIKETQPTT